jgi:hypothetical protein
MDGAAVESASAAVEAAGATVESAGAAMTTATAPVTAAAAAAARHAHEAGGADVFPVEEVECCKTDVRHFLFAKDEALVQRGVQVLRNIGGRKSGRGCASDE